MTHGESLEPAGVLGLRPTGRVARAVRRHGLREALRRAVGRALDATVRRGLRAEAHVWYELPFDDAPAPAAPDGYAIRRGGAVDVDRLAAADLVNPIAARADLARGARLWVATAADEPVYLVWVYRDRVPSIAAPGGWLALPEGVACVEGAFALPEHRNRGLQRRTIRHAIAEVRAEGGVRVIAKVADDNAASQRSLAAIGAREIARMRFRRVGPWRRTRIEARAEG
jgi:L-amino acid N-acyltransferase YncA